MRRRAGELQVGPRAISWLREGVLKDRPMVLLAHGAGAPYSSSFMEYVATGLVRRKCAVTRFHFPYMERRVREVRGGAPDPAKVLLQTWGAIIDLAKGWRGVGPLVLAGKSMGGRMASMWLAEQQEAHPVQAAVYLGYPLHPPGKPDRLRSQHLAEITVPQLFLSGTRDQLCRLDLLKPVLAPVPSACLHVVEGGDHSLAGRKSQPVDEEVWLDVMTDFVHRVVATP